MGLEGLGLSEDETAVYYELVAMRSPASAVELEAAADLRRSTAERALAALARRGLARRVPGRTARYTAVDPAIGAASLMRDREVELAEARKEVRELEVLYRAVTHGQHPAELIEVVEGRDQIMALYRRLVASATTQMRYFSRPPYFSNDPDDDVQQARRMAEGVEFRVIYDSDTIGDAVGLAAVRSNVARGERARVVSRLPMEMMIVDDSRALIPVDLETLQSAYLVETSTLLVALAALFETTWEHSLPAHLYGPTTGTRPAADPRAQHDREALLTMLAAGMSDKAIQRSMGLSARTLQRRIQDLYIELGAQTRFQAGVAARHHGWIEPSEDR